VAWPVKDACYRERASANRADKKPEHRQPDKRNRGIKTRPLPLIKVGSSFTVLEKEGTTERNRKENRRVERASRAQIANRREGVCAKLSRN